MTRLSKGERFHDEVGQEKETREWVCKGTGPEHSRRDKVGGDAGWKKQVTLHSSTVGSKERRTEKVGEESDFGRQKEGGEGKETRSETGQLLPCTMPGLWRDEWEGAASTSAELITCGI